MKALFTFAIIFTSLTIQAFSENVIKDITTEDITVCQVPIAVNQASISQQALDFFSTLGSTSEWPPRWYCGEWSTFHGWFYIISDFLIWLAYFAIPLTLFYFIRKSNQRLPFQGVFSLFILFIAACGITHLIEVVIFWIPIYKISAIAKFGTALVSVGTVFALVRVTPSALQLKSPAQLEAEIQRRKEAEQELLKLNAELERKNTSLEATQTVAGIGHWDFDLETQNLYWSDEIFRIHELDTPNPPSVSDALSFYHEEYKEQITEAFQKAVEQGITYDLELKMVTAKGREIWVRAIGEPVADENGKIYKVQGLFQDVDLRRKREIEIESLNHELEKRVMARTSELESANEELEQLTTIATHDLKSPLANIEGYLLYTKDHISEDNPKVNESIEWMSKSITEAKSKISNLVRVSKFRNETIKEKEVIHVDQVLSKLIETAIPGLDRKHVQINLKDAPNIWFPRSDFESVFQNLLTNAVKYQSDKRPLEISITAKIKKEWTTITFSDNGLGIDLELQKDKLFKMFQRFHDHREGDGLGLYLVKKILLRNGADIELESQIDQGTTFHLKFPNNED